MEIAQKTPETIPQVCTYDARYLPAFVELNRQWIENHFVVEEHDLHQLNNPEKNILALGGEIFFVLAADQVVGTCAMVPVGQGGFELAKMAVSPSYRGRGYGDLLIQSALSWARQQGASHVMLLSNTVLEPAISLYKKHGFQVVKMGCHPDYQRCNIEMAFRFNGLQRD